MLNLEAIIDDQRNFERFDLTVPAKVEIIKAGQETEREASLVTSNICAGGSFLVTEDPIPQGTRVNVDLVLSIDKLKEMLDSHCRVIVQGEVVRTEDNGVAVRFDENYQIMPVKCSVH